MPKVSVIVPVHNTAQYLNKCIKSITNQTLKDIEIILVENGSTDSSLELCHQIAKTDERIKVWHIDKGDVSAARNEGISHANSNYIGFVDSDDTIHPEMYEEMYTLATAHNLGMVCSNFHRVYDDKPDKYIFARDGKVQILSANEICTLNFLGKVSRSACTHLYRKDLFEGTLFPEGMYHEDRAMAFVYMSKCGKGATINKSYYNYYQRIGSRIHSKSYKYYKDFIAADCKMLEYINNSDYYNTKEKAYVAKYIAISLLRKLRHLLVTCSDEQKEETKKLCRRISLIPPGTQLTFKTRLIKIYIEKRIL